MLNGRKVIVIRDDSPIKINGALEIARGIAKTQIWQDGQDGISVDISDYGRVGAKLAASGVCWRLAQ